MHVPTGIFWANLTHFSLQVQTFSSNAAVTFVKTRQQAADASGFSVRLEESGDVVLDNVETPTCADHHCDCDWVQEQHCTDAASHDGTVCHIDCCCTVHGIDTSGGGVHPEESVSWIAFESTSGHFGLTRTRSHCRCVSPFTHFIPNSLTYSVPLF
jgi:hypothetical protein